MIDGAGAEDDFGAFGDEVAAYGGVFGGLAEGEGHGGVEAEYFVAEGVEEGEAVKCFSCYWDRGIVDGGEVGADFFSQTGLIVRMLAEAMNGPDDGCGGCFVASGEESHHLIDEVFVGEATRAKRDRDDVDVGFFIFGSELALFLMDQLAADLSDRLCCSGEILVSGHGYRADQPGR